MTVITAIIPIHNRPSENLDRLIFSLTEQQGFIVDILVIDTSDDILCQVSNRAVCQHHYATHVLLPRRAFWKARSLNVGLNMSLGKYTMCIDADMILHPEFLNRAKVHFRNQEIQPFIMAVCGYLPQDCDYTNWDAMVALAHQTEVSRRLSPGACQLARTSWFKRAGGYDEKFHGVDGVDDDMMVRARKDKLEEVWIEDPIMILHQWHERSTLKGLDSDKFSVDVPVIIERDWLIWE